VSGRKAFPALFLAMVSKNVIRLQYVELKHLDLNFWQIGRVANITVLAVVQNGSSGIVMWVVN
jgi:hypothetical protein